MSSRHARKIIAALTAAGFRRADDGDHVRLVYWTRAGLRTSVHTKTSHGAGEIGDDLLSKMARQCGVTKAQFLLFVDGKMDRDTYERILRDTGRIR